VVVGTGAGRRELTPRSAGIALCLGVLACAGPAAGPGWALPRAPLYRLEQAYQELRAVRDQITVTRWLGDAVSPRGLARDSLLELDSVARRGVERELALIAPNRLAAEDARALETIRRAWDQGLSEPPPAEAGQAGQRPDCPASPSADLDSLGARVLACYGAAADRIVVDADTLNRLAILGLLGRTDARDRRERLFRALAPVWRSVNGDNDSASPYRRLITLRLEAWRGRHSPIGDKGPAFGIPADTLEAWLVRALERWHDLGPDTLLEPWDWYYRNGLANRQLSRRVPGVTDILAVNDSFYRALGADPARQGTRYDLRPNPGKYPVSITDFGGRNRFEEGRWLAGEPWIVASYLAGGFDNLTELLHEGGHTIHIAAIRTRPAFLDWPDNDTFIEALADVPALEVYEPAWQYRFLGDSVPLAESIRARYASIAMDLAWGLFEIRVYGEAGADPNAVWTDITSRYLRIRPHPEWSWWAMRGQLVDSPGDIINYGLGAFIAADIRARLATICPGCTAGKPEYFPFVSGLIYRFGLERPSRQVLEAFLGRPVRPEALLADLTRATPPRR
jgi:hypothetical protein